MKNSYSRWGGGGGGNIRDGAFLSKYYFYKRSSDQLMWACILGCTGSAHNRGGGG